MFLLSFIINFNIKYADKFNGTLLKVSRSLKSKPTENDRKLVKKFENEQKLLRLERTRELQKYAYIKTF